MVEVGAADIQNFKSRWVDYYKKNCIAMESRGRKVPKDQKVTFMISAEKHFTFDSTQRGVVVARPTIDNTVKHTFNFLRKGAPLPNFPNTPAYAGKRPIKLAKVSDIKKLMPYIPHKHKKFFNRIVKWPTVTNNSDEDSD